MLKANSLISMWVFTVILDNAVGLSAENFAPLKGMAIIEPEER